MLGKELIVSKDPKSPVAEIFRTLRTNIQFMNTKGKLKTLLITSTLPGEGKSWVSSNLAIAFAQTGKKVVLVDADMRKGRQFKIFDTTPIPGLSNYLTGIDYNTGEEISKDLSDYIQKTEVENLYLLPAGNIPPNPSELLISEQMIDLLEQLKEISDIVIIDGLPCLLVTDSLILTRIVDSTVIVTASKQTKKDNLKQVVNNIKNVGGKIGGIVLNKVPVTNKDLENSYYYGSTSRFEDVPVKKVKKETEMHKRIEIARKADLEELKRKTAEYEKIKEEKVQDKVNTYKKEEIQENENMCNKEEVNVINETTKNNGASHITPEKIEDLQHSEMQKTYDILKQVNEYLENEKKNLNL